MTTCTCNPNYDEYCEYCYNKVKQECDEAEASVRSLTKLLSDALSERDEARECLREAITHLGNAENTGPWVIGVLNRWSKAAGLEVELSDHLPDAGKLVPWKGEPTPIVDAAEDDWNCPDGYCQSGVSRNLERRMRAAERLLKAKVCKRECGCCKEAKAHLEVAKKEDER